MAEKTIDPLMVELFDFKLRKGDIQKSRIIVSTIECLAQLGIEKTTFEAIALKLGTQRSHIAYYFKDKEDIYLAAYMYIAVTFQQVSIESLKNANSSKDMVDKYIEGYFLWAAEHSDQLSVMFLLFYLCTHKPKFRDINQRIREGGIERVTSLLKDQMKLKISKAKAKAIATAVQGTLYAALVNAYTFKAEDVDLKKTESETKSLINSLIKSMA